jgi:site-specific recombinase XerD
VSDAVAAGVDPAGPTKVARRRRLEEATRGYAAASRAPNILRAYRADLRDFGEWCADHRPRPLPAVPGTLVLCVTALAEASTIQRRRSAISQAHQLAGHVPSPAADPLVRTTMAGIRRTLGTAPAQKATVVTAELRRLLGTTPPESLAGRRDRALLLLLGFAGGLRGSELVALDVEDVTETSDGLGIVLRRSKTDQEGERRCVAGEGSVPPVLRTRVPRRSQQLSASGDGQCGSRPPLHCRVRYGAI